MDPKRETPLKISKRIISLVFGLLGLTLLLFGCGQANQPTVDTGTEDPVGDATAIEDALASISQQPAPVDQCVACHSDKDQLINTASPEAEVISENEGEG
jgi:hypothetical protein